MAGKQQEQVRRRKKPPRDGAAMAEGSHPTAKSQQPRSKKKEDEQPLLSQSDSDSVDLTQDISTSLDTKVQVPTDEASWQIALQVFFPYIIAGFGMVAAGMLLDKVQVYHLIECSRSPFHFSFQCYVVYIINSP